MDQSFVSGQLETAVGPVPVVESAWSATDLTGTIKARIGIGRMRYRIVPGIYALGSPDRTSPVLVTANYKMSFDRLRRGCVGLDAWILVLDTNGINVWCAAGKGTFGTDELVERVVETGVIELVDHRRLILPQLAAPGVAGHEVERRSGFEVVWGPIMAEDVPAFLRAGLEATPEMRRRRFPLTERMALIPIELLAVVKWVVPALAVVSLLGGLTGAEGYWTGVLHHAATGGLALLASITAGSVLTPVLLPWLPGRAFSLKGAVLGLIVVGAALASIDGGDPSVLVAPESLAWLLIGVALSAFLAMNFTGSTPFTSLSGVKREMRVAVPVEIAIATIGVILWMSSMWLPGGAG